MSQAAYPHLWQMFGAYFHQDWELEGDDWPDLVRNFAGGQPQAELDATAAELDRLVADHPDDAALDRELYDVLGCYYLPNPDLGGTTLRVWLGQIATFIRRGAGPAEPGAAADGGGG
jgi:hypothetical protein